MKLFWLGTEIPAGLSWLVFSPLHDMEKGFHGELQVVRQRQADPFRQTKTNHFLYREFSDK